MQRRRFALWFGVFAAWMGLCIRVGTSEVPLLLLDRHSDTGTRWLSMLILLLVGWFLLFPWWRYLLRARLGGRRRPGWLAELPGLLSLIGIVILMLVFVGTANQNLRPLFGDVLQLVLTILGVIPIALGMIIGMGLSFECLREDLETDDSEVFF